jgi:hypothetical protein
MTKIKYKLRYKDNGIWKWILWDNGYKESPLSWESTFFHNINQLQEAISHFPHLKEKFILEVFTESSLPLGDFLEYPKN